MRKFISLLLVFYLGGLMTAQGNSTDCHHESNTVGYYDNLRFIVGNITEIHGTELTLVAKGKDKVAVRVFHTTKETTYDFRKSSKETIHRIESTYLRENDGTLWAVSYCYYCREVYAVSKLEGL